MGSPLPSSGQLRLLLLLLVACLLATYLFFPSLQWLIGEWSRKEEYSHGMMIPLVAAYLVWQRRGLLARSRQHNSWPGLLLLVCGLGGLVLGRYSTLFIISHYSLLLVITGLALSAFGLRITRHLLFPIALLGLAIPLPNFLYGQLSAQLQLISSALGVEVIRACNISVYLEGNVIDLGAMQLQVVEACNGLRYLFPLMSVAFICAYLFHAPLWQRVLIFLSSIPITVIMNSLRIGLIGVTVEFWGVEMAEGFLHDFEGWAVFMVCTALLLLEIWLFARLLPPRQKLQDCFGIDSVPIPPDHLLHSWRVTPSLYAAVVLLIGAAVTLFTNPTADEYRPERQEFVTFPMSFAGWRGTRETMSEEVLDALDLDDYLLADYRSPVAAPINLYVAYYGSQTSGESAHSPRSCIPGGGWQITSLSQVELDPQTRANRVVIQKGELRQLVYYWFDLHGRNLTNEYLIKWYLFQDGLMLNRSDGALLRLTTPILAEDGEQEADRRLRDFHTEIAKRLPPFVPAAAGHE